MRGMMFQPWKHQEIREHPDRDWQTRRLMTKANSVIGEGGDWANLDFYGGKVHIDKAFDFDWLEIERKEPLPFVDGKDEIGHIQYLHVPYNWSDDETVYRVYPRLEIGEPLYIKEAIYRAGNCTKYKLDDELAKLFGLQSQLLWRWKGEKLSSMFLPWIAARDVFKVLQIRAGRVQEITEADAEAEGVIPLGSNDEHGDERSYVEGFHIVWDKINPKHPWSSNPWVWIYMVHLVRKDGLLI